MKEKRFQKIYIEITNVCNLKCAFCPDTKRIKGFMTAENFEEAVKKVCKYTNLIYLHVKGEPLLHPNLKEILEICDKYGIMVNLTTNATLILDKVNILKKSKALRQINLSIHSIKQNDERDMVYNTENYLKNVFSAVRILNDETDILISFRLWNLKDMQANPENKEIIDMIKKEYKIEDLLSK
jgi:MoaA/NifB/PqqE/SkfB family radical SAM enzyme